MQIYILGGSPCSGKSTIAERLASQYSLHYYQIDQHTDLHAKRCTAEQQPVFTHYLQATWQERWMRDIDEQVAEELAIARECWPMILQDIATVDQPILIEGAMALPELVWESFGAKARVVYLVPEQKFQYHYYQQRPWIKSILQECSQPDQAFDNWMQRDQRFAHHILQQAQHYKYQHMLVDGSRSLDDTYQQVATWLGLHARM